MKRVAFGLALAGLLAVSGAGFAAEKWEFPGIGQMSVPKHVTVEAGEQMTISDMNTKSPKIFWARKGIPDANFYTITWKDGADFSYGYALSGVVGAQFLQREGVLGYRNLTLAEQLDVIAETINRDIIARGAYFEGAAPLLKNKDEKHPRYEGSFILTRLEEDVSYRTAYHVTLQMNEVRIYLGLVAVDADQADFAKSMSEMLKKRTFPKNKNILKDL